MTTKAAFKADEWSTITTAPALTGMLMVAADKGGTVRETLAISRAYASAREQATDALLKEILASPPAIDRATAQRTAEDLQREVTAKLREAIRTLETRATEEEVNAYKRFVYSIAETVAHAHREGAVLGVGGKEVSDKEQALLDEIGALFDAAPSAHGALPRHNFSEQEARDVAESLGIDWDSAPFDLEQFRTGMEVELEHGRRDPATNVTDDDPLTTGKIALAHLHELPDYYTRLARMEGEAGS